MTMNNTEATLDEQINQATKAAHEARLEAAAADRLSQEGTLDGDEALRRYDDYIQKSSRCTALEREAARLLHERDGTDAWKLRGGTPMTNQEIVAREIARTNGGH